MLETEPIDFSLNIIIMIVLVVHYLYVTFDVTESHALGSWDRGSRYGGARRKVELVWMVNGCYCLITTYYAESASAVFNMHPYTTPTRGSVWFLLVLGVVTMVMLHGIYTTS